MHSGRDEAHAGNALEEEELVALVVAVGRLLLERALADERATRGDQVRIAHKLSCHTSIKWISNRRVLESNLALKLDDVGAVLLLAHRLVDVHRDIAEQQQQHAVSSRGVADRKSVV